VEGPRTLRPDWLAQIGTQWFGGGLAQRAATSFFGGHRSTVEAVGEPTCSEGTLCKDLRTARSGFS
jgi:hypothetical protein